MKTITLDHYDMVKTGELDLAKLGELAAQYGEKPMSEKELDRLNDRDFGLIVVASDGSRSREFPLCNKFEVIMSKAASVANTKLIPKQARNILDMRLGAAARRFLPGMHKVAEAQELLSNIYALTPTDEHRLTSKGMEKTADCNFAINESYNGGAMQRFPIDTAEQVTRRMRRFETRHPSMHIKYAFEYARNIAERAEVLGVEIPKDSAINLYKTAAMSKYAKQNINERLKFAPDVSHSAYLGLMLKTASANPEQLAVALDFTDRQYAMDAFYGVHYPDAGASVLDFRKRAEVIDVSGVEVDKEELLEAMSSDEEMFTELLGAEALEEMKKDPEAVLTSLPTPYKQKVLEVLTERSS
ncbi:hypothetical protein KA005_35240 [bacterium]|nr:hypothetical protein [bacterium]